MARCARDRPRAQLARQGAAATPRPRAWGTARARKTLKGEAMSKSEEIREIVGWLDGFSAAVWLLPSDKVSEEYPAMYEEKVARLRELLAKEG